MADMDQQKWRRIHREEYNAYQRACRIARSETYPKKKCECSVECQTIIPAINKMGKPAKYAWGHNAKGGNNWNWKGGRVKHSQGYILVKQPNHPRANHDGYVHEAVLVLEQKLGRYLHRDRSEE